MSLATARSNALEEIERTERWYRTSFLGACALEAAVLAILLFAADLSNRTHLILIAGFVGSYSIIVLAIVALGTHVSRSSQRILQAIDLTRQAESAD